MDIQVNESGNTAFVKVIGKIKGNTFMTLNNCLEKFKSAANICNIVLDFNNVPFIDSSGIGGLVYINKILKKNNKKLIFDPLPKHIKSLFMDCSLDYWCDIPGLA